MFLDRNAACPIYCSTRQGYMTPTKASCKQDKSWIMHKFLLGFDKHINHSSYPDRCSSEVAKIGKHSFSTCMCDTHS